MLSKLSSSLTITLCSLFGLGGSSALFVLLLFSMERNDGVLALPLLPGVSSPCLERKKGTATDLERRKEGSASTRLEEEEDEDEEEDSAEQEQGRAVWQLGQRLPRRSRRQAGQMPLRLRFEGCFGHFQTSSSPTYTAIETLRFG